MNMSLRRTIRLILVCIGLCALTGALAACSGRGGDGRETGTGEETGAQTHAVETLPEDTGTQPETTETEAETKETPMEKNVAAKTNGAVEGVTFSQLPLGKVSAESWLKHQLTLLADNIASDFEQLSPDVCAEGAGKSGWLGGSGESWERGTYYVRGLVSLAYELDNEKLKAQAQKWIDWTLNSQTAGGAFGPYASRPAELDYWPLMPMLMALESYYDATQDGRVIPFLERYFAWEAESLKTRPLSDWGKARGGDNIMAVYWLYEKTHDEKLLDLCRLLYEQTDNWADTYDTKAWSNVCHIVNVHESFKLFPLMYAVTGDRQYLDVYYRGVDNLYMTSGRADGMSNGDELTRGISAVFGTETCAVVERMLSDEAALALLRDARLADRLELTAYNALPQQLLPDGNGQVYFTMQNQIEATLGNHGFTSDGGDRSVYGTPGGYPCCVHNYMMGWPLFAASLWMETDDNGLAVGAYGPCRVTAAVGSGTQVTLTEETDYPFRDTIKLKLQADKTDTFPLYLRVPEWCAPGDVTVTVNGHPVTADWQSGAYFALTAAWDDGDEITLTFPSRIRLEMNENNSVSVKKGAVLYALALNEKWETINHNPNNWNLKAGERYGSFNITTGDAWNVALKSLSLSDPEKCFTVTEREMRADTRFVQEDAPVVLTASAVIVPGWTMNTVTRTASRVPQSPLTADRVSSETREVRLIPYGFARLRITAIPWCGEETPTYTASAVGGAYVFENVIASTAASGVVGEGQPRENYTLHINVNASADGRFALLVNRKVCGTIECKAGDNNLKIAAPMLSPSYRNRVELVPEGDVTLTGASLTVSAEAGKTVVYQAAEGRLLGAARNDGTSVGGIDKVGDGILLPKVTIPESGTYTVRVYHCSAIGDAVQTLRVNDTSVCELHYKQTGTTWGTFSDDCYAEAAVDLPAGTYALRLIKTAAEAGFAEIRTIELTLTEAHEVAPLEDDGKPVLRVETESGKVLGKCYSTGTHIAGIDNPGDGVELSVTLPEGGRYTVRIHHAAPMGTATHTLKLDGKTVGRITYPGTKTGWGQFTEDTFGELDVDLPAGTHKLTIQREADDTGFAEVDAVEFVPAE